MLRQTWSPLRLPLKSFIRPSHVQQLAFTRFKSSKQDDSTKKSFEKKELASKNNDDLSSYSVNQETSRSAPAPMSHDLGVEELMKSDNKPYIPKMKHKRLTYEYPGLPNEDDYSKHSNAAKQPKTRSRWSRYVPKIITVVVIAWGAYTIKVWVYDDNEYSNENDLLDPNEFHKFRITHKEQIDDDHYLIEVMPTTTQWQYSYYANYETKSIWNGDRVWSVDIKQPQIMVVRQYTPLPLYFMKSEYTYSGEKKPLLKVIDSEVDDYDKQGTMCFYIKKYDDGEVSKYVVNKNVGDEIELRGPNIEYKFPYHPLKPLHRRPVFKDLPSKVEPELLLENIKKANNVPDFDNLTFFTAGTGIAPALQVLLSRNPYRGFIDLHYSAQKPGEIKPLERFLFFLEKLDRIKLHEHYDSNPKSRLAISNVKSPEKPSYVSPMRQESEQKSENLSPEESLRLRMKILDEERRSDADNSDSTKERPTRYENALEQAFVTRQEAKKDASLALVCGPDGYVDYVAGKRYDATNEQGPVKGLLGNRKWSNENVYKL
ncbi:hypothetical protein QCA50_009476 [Cerrena zonata]|uniref:FAD-binding FR-type domain-containing protein n=1 Tax=Cerrena zonata TaxID=2478898 RepID=A0AAW0G7R3_9APHY